ncbi:MAG: universal stress protein [Acidobacteriaceae bacterium]|nr:universal stress protein [Acidobacteriaceae bacterium]
MIQKILFPVDFSPSCFAIAAYVKRAAVLFDAQVTLVHVCDLESHNGFELCVRPPQEIAEEHWTVARHRLDSFLGPKFPPSTCPRVLLSGEPAAQIAEFARTGGFDLVIMPTHAGRFRRMLLGSTTAKVLNDVHCPVLTTEHACTIAPRSMEHREWVCGIGLSEDSERVLRLVSRAAAQAQARLSLVHAGQNGHSAFIELGCGKPVECPEKAEARRRLEELAKKVGCVATIDIAAGPVKEALLDAARQSDADVLIIGRTPRSGAVGRMRDLTYSLVRDSPIPVLSV